MKVYVDEQRCQGHTRCHSLAPEVFDLREEDGHGYAKQDEVPKELEAKARRAAEGCPERAIRIED